MRAFLDLEDAAVTPKILMFETLWLEADFGKQDHANAVVRIQ